MVTNDGSLTPQAVNRLFAEASDCHYCGKTMHPREKTLDHVTPLSRGGSHTIGNVVVCCWPCNEAKGNRTPDEWKGAA